MVEKMVKEFKKIMFENRYSIHSVNIITHSKTHAIKSPHIGKYESKYGNSNRLDNQSKIT